MGKLIIDITKRKATIDKNIYGHFSEHLGRCIYQGIYVGEDSPIPNRLGIRNDVVKALRNIRIPVLRWPGGCFADEYHWKDGIGSKASRKKMINTNWGGLVEDNRFGTHEFMELCDQLDCEPYINGNLGSGTVQEMSEWVEYMTFEGVSPMALLRKENGREAAWQVKYFGIGNENWGCGGNMRPEYYADEYRRYQTYVHNFASNRIFKIACGPSDTNYEWTKILMERAGGYMDGLTLHYYTVTGDSWEHKGSSIDFTEDEYYTTIAKTLRMEEMLKKHIDIMDQYDPSGKVALIVDEWGCWHDVLPGTHPGFLYQQNTMRDAMVAAINLNLFNKYAHRVKMANIAQVVNCLQSVILTEGDQILLTPTYHVFDLYKVHQNATLLESSIISSTIGTPEMGIEDLYESASIDAKGDVHVTICNVDPHHAKTVAAELIGFLPRSMEGYVLSGDYKDHNTFFSPKNVRIKPFTDITATSTGFAATLPPCSIVRISMRP